MAFARPVSLLLAPMEVHALRFALNQALASMQKAAPAITDPAERRQLQSLGSAASRILRQLPATLEAQEANAGASAPS